GAAGPQSAPHGGRDQAGAGLQSVPLRHPHRDHQGGATGRRTARQGRAHDGRHGGGRAMKTTSHAPRLSRRQFLAATGSLAVTFTFPALVKRGMAAAGPATDAGSQLVDKTLVSAYVQLMADGTVR